MNKKYIVWVKEPTGNPYYIAITDNLAIAMNKIEECKDLYIRDRNTLVECHDGLDYVLFSKKEKVKFGILTSCQLE